MNFGLGEKHKNLYPVTLALLLVFAMVSLVWSQFYPHILQRYSLNELSPVVLSASLIGLGMLVFQLFAGFLADKFGPKPTVAISGIFYLLGMFIISLTFNYALWEDARLFWYFGSLVVGFGAGFFVGTYPVVIARWFSENTGKAFGIAIFGQNISPLLMSPLIAYLIINYDLQTTFIALGFLIFATFYSIGVLLWKVPEVKKTHSDSSLREALSDARFWILFVVMFSTATAWFLILMNIATIVFEGLSSSMSSEYIKNQFVPLFMSITAIGSAIGSFFWGALNDRIGGPFKVLPLLYSIAGIFIFIFALTYFDPFLILIFGILVYFCLGGEPTVHFTAVPTFFGKKFTGRITALLNMSVMTSSIIGPYLGSFLRDLTTSYLSALYLSAFLHFFATIVVLFGVRSISGVRRC
ncbi:MAG: MFS transporter [Archaeoglobaceae archaeon]|nr:MFS transporter [Archaeoglobaceae archaeon]MDW8127853.1 MFS transporter [Archaeoglobaceae archaeon]